MLNFKESGPYPANSLLLEPAMVAILVPALWVIVSLIICMIATQKGRNPILWFLCSVALSPALGWVMANWLDERQPAAVIALTNCPYCGAVIAENAEGCLHCHADFPEGLPRTRAA